MSLDQLQSGSNGGSSGAYWGSSSARVHIVPGTQSSSLAALPEIVQTLAAESKLEPAPTASAHANYSECSPAVAAPYWSIFQLRGVPAWSSESTERRNIGTLRQRTVSAW